MTLDFTLRSQPADPDGLQLLGEHILHADRSDETDWLEWKSSADLSERKWQFEISRQILGMSNRMPDTRDRGYGGCGYVFLGIEPGSVRGVERLDPATLQDVINSYLGATGPHWDYHYITIGGKIVLAIIVSAPRPGDPLHTLRKQYEGHSKGTIFARKRGKTEQADPDDVQNLQHRLLGPRLSLTVTLTGDVPIPWFHNSEINANIERIARSRRESMLTRANGFVDDSRGGRSSWAIGLAAHQSVLGRDDRSIEEYTKEVDEWHDAWIEGARAHWLGKYFERGYGIYSMVSENRTDSNFRSVEVCVELDDARVLTETYEDEARLPRPPRAFGTPGWMGNFRDFGDLGLSIASPYDVYSPPDLYVEYDDLQSNVVWNAGDIRPRQRIRSADLYFAISSNCPRESLTGHWTATATNVDGIVEGQLALPIAESAIAFDELEHELDTTAP